MPRPVTPEWFETVQSTVNEDERFARVASEFDATVLFEADAEAVATRFDAGRLVEVIDDPTFTTWDVALRAPRETWDGLLEETPRPLHHDLIGAWLHGDLTIEGDLELAIRHLRPLKRLHAVFQEVEA